MHIQEIFYVQEDCHINRLAHREIFFGTYCRVSPHLMVSDRINVLFQGTITNLTSDEVTWRNMLLHLP